eukprot:7492904-Alexandrium_andersonii.AAC.1
MRDTRNPEPWTPCERERDEVYPGRSAVRTEPCVAGALMYFRESARQAQMKLFDELQADDRWTIHKDQ